MSEWNKDCEKCHGSGNVDVDPDADWLSEESKDHLAMGIRVLTICPLCKPRLMEEAGERIRRNTMNVFFEGMDAVRREERRPAWLKKLNRMFE